MLLRLIQQKATLMSYLFEILLPITDRKRRSELDVVRSEITARFGGVTLT